MLWLGLWLLSWCRADPHRLLQGGQEAMSKMPWLLVLSLEDYQVLLAQALAPAEAVWENDAIEMKDGIKSLQETIAQQQQTLVQQQLALVRLESTCSP